MSVDKLHNTTDAGVWTEEFLRANANKRVTQINNDADPTTVDFGTMIGWFANAIETGRIAGAAAAGGRLTAAENENRLWRTAARLTDEYTLTSSQEGTILYWADGWSLFDVWQAVKAEGKS